MEQRNYYEVGPAGMTKHGHRWSLRDREIVQIFISFGQNYINCISFQYVKDGKLVMSPNFGSSTFRGLGFQTVKLDYPSEYITGIAVQLNSYVESLSVITNKRTYGPFGKAEHKKEMEFKIDIGSHNHFAGFHGTQRSDLLESIGLYFEPLTALPPAMDSSDGVVH